MADSEVKQEQREPHINSDQDSAVAESQQPDQNKDTEPSADVSSPASRPSTSLQQLTIDRRSQNDYSMNQKASNLSLFANVTTSVIHACSMNC
jgi:hypothetical protein